MAEALAISPQELAAQERQNQEELERSRVHALDIDFLLILGFAFLVDAVDIILELLAWIVVPKLIAIIIDLIVGVIILGWMFWRINKIEKTKRKQQQAMRQAGRQLGRAATKGPLRRVLVRGGATLVGELVPFVGLIPFWTITVVSTLREK